MRIALFSDLHLEFGSPFVPPVDLAADVIVLAGDISSPGRKVPAWARQTFGDRPVVYVSGNHELYGQVMHKVEREIRAEAALHGVCYLQCGSVVIGGVRFLGCTLWTDLRLPILSLHTGEFRSDPDRARLEALARLSDFSSIRLREAVPGGWAEGSAYTPVRFRPHHMTAIHHEQRAWLTAALAEPFDGPKVVVTHHGPTAASVVDRYKDDWLSPFYASELPSELFELPMLWVHGHTHDSLDYRVGNCRVICNPRGYPKSRLIPDLFENQSWSPYGYPVEVG